MNELYTRIKELADKHYPYDVIDLRTHKAPQPRPRYVYTDPDGNEYYSIIRASEATGKTAQTVRNWSHSGRNGWSIRKLD